MSILMRTIITAFLLIVPLVPTAYSASADKQEPIAQVYEVKGGAMMKSSFDNSVSLVKKGCLLAIDDSLTLDSNASIAMYFKSGGRKEVRAKDVQVTYKVAEILPKAQAYGQNAPLFGATRGPDMPESASQIAGFFYPQEAVILDSAPLIEFTIFNGRGEGSTLGGATVQVLKDGAVLDSKKFNDLAYGSPYVYQPPKLSGQTEYIVEIKYELQKSLGSVVNISFPLYISGSLDTKSSSKYEPFSDPVYRSFESTAADYKGEKRTITALKQLVRRGSSSPPVVALELFIP